MMRDQPPTPVAYPAHPGGVPAYPVHPYPYGYSPYHEQLEDEDSFDPLKLLWFVIHYRWLIAAFLLAGLVCGVVFTFLQTPLYKASAKIEILTAGARVFQDLEVVSQSSDWRIYETAREKILSHDLARRVVFNLNLTEDDTFLAPTPTFSLWNIVRRITGSTQTASLDELTPEEREKRAVGLIQDSTTASLIRDTSIISVDYSHPLPKYTVLVADQIAKSYIDQNIDQKTVTSGLARQFIEQQVRDTEKKLQASERELLQYAQNAGITVTGDEVSLISGNITEINNALSEAIQERLAAERYNRQVLSGDAATLPEVFKSPSIQAAKENIAELKATYQQNLATLKPGYPEMRRLQAQITELTAQMNAEIGAIAKSVQLNYEQAKEKEAALKRELTELDRQQSQFQEKNIQYTILKREVDSNRAQYESLIDKLNEVGVGSELRSASASIVDLAQIPDIPYSPRLKVNLVAAMALFGAMAAALIYLLELLNNTFSVPDQLESELKIPVLGIIPQVDESDASEAFKDPGSALSEAYRTLRTSVQFTGTDESIHTLLVTSPEPAEGKTTTAYKLAEDFAALGRRVLVIDADLRKPRLHRMFNTDNGIGLSNLLSNVVKSGTSADLFRATANPKITFLSAGTIPPNPADLLISQRMGLTLHYCQKRYDLVIVDSPPVMGLSDAPVLARQVDATLLVVSAKQVSRKSAKNALARLKSAGANVVGTVMTKFSVDKLDYNYAYRYMHDNYYAYQGADESASRLQNQTSGNETKLNHAPGPIAAARDFLNRLARRFR